MSSESHTVHFANSEPGVTTASVDSAAAADEGPGSPVGKAGRHHRLRRARVTKNPCTSTLFSQEDPTDPVVPPKTVIRCSYNRNGARSYENIFGGPDPNARTRSLVHHRYETQTNTKQNLFGDPPSTAASQSAAASSSTGTHESTFDVLFGVPELIPNERRPYEEDTYSKLFGEPDTVPAGRSARENTQDNLFGPPLARCASPPPPQRPNSQTENTQEDLFGPPLPAKPGRVAKARDRSLLYLFKPEALDEPVPARAALTRAGRFNAETQEKLFGDPPKTPPPPPMREDTTRNLFAPLETNTGARIAQYEESRYNPITGEGHAEKHTAPPPPSTSTTKPRFKRPPTPAPFSLGCGLDARDPTEAPVVRMILEQQRKRWAQLNTITGDPTSYASASARKIEC